MLVLCQCCGHADTHCHSGVLYVPPIIQPASYSKAAIMRSVLSCLLVCSHHKPGTSRAPAGFSYYDIMLKPMAVASTAVLQQGRQVSSATAVPRK